MSKIYTTTVGELIRNKNTPERSPKVEHYLVPDYQRGFRWDKDNVRALLEDIDSFMQSRPNASDFYCLQPIVVYETKDSDDKTIWEVIDGQQRLTTIYLMLNCLYSRDVFELSYQKRELSGDFLKKLCKEKERDDSNPDFHYMSQAYFLIDEWINKKDDKCSGYAERFLNILKNQVQVIWYEINCKDDNEKIDIFNRLNIGKIPLTDAELVKALILSKICIDLSEREKNIRQVELAAEWDAMERELQKQSKWDFLNPKKPYSSRIEFIFDLIAKPKDGKKYSTYLTFEKKVKDGIDYSIGEIEEHNAKEKENASNMWAEIKESYARINSWFCETTDKPPVIYHYIGYIFARRLASCEKILELSKQNKDVFEKSLKTMIQDDVKNINLKELDYESNKGDIEKILLLFNVLSCLRISNGQNNRFPFNRYNEIRETDNWSLEHIHAQNSQDAMTNEKAIISWINDTNESLKSISSIIKEDTEIKIDELKKELSSLKENLSSKAEFSEEDKSAFDDLRCKITDAFDSKTTHESKHDLNNLALLSKSDNSALNNYIFPVKREKIIQMEKEGKFIPPCTRNVFLKFYSDSNSQPYYWSTEDKEAYFKEIESVINSFLEEKNV